MRYYVNVITFTAIAVAKKIRKTIMLSDHVDMALRLRSANSRKNASLIIEEALNQFLEINKSTNPLSSHRS